MTELELGPLDSPAGVQEALRMIEREWAELGPKWSRAGERYHRLNLRVEFRKAQLYVSLRDLADSDQKVTDVREHVKTAIWLEPVSDTDPRLLMEEFTEVLGSYKACEKLAKALEEGRSTCQSLLKSYLAFEGTGSEQQQPTTKPTARTQRR